MLLVDTADQASILEALRSPFVTGFTTNPSLVARAAGAESLPLPQYLAKTRELCLLLKDPRAKAVRHFMIQAVGSPGDMLEQADAYAKSLGEADRPRLWVKMPPTREGLSCCGDLKRLNLRALVTAVFTAAQAHAAMEAGADGVAVYLGRLMRLEKSWEKRVRVIAEVTRQAGKTLLLASFPGLKTVERALEFSRDLTVPPNILKQLLESKHSEAAIKDFESKVTLFGGPRTRSGQGRLETPGFGRGAA